MAQTELKDKTEENIKIQCPKGHKVILWNDDFTPIDFVWEVLQDIFRKTKEDSVMIASQAQKNGSCTVGTYTLDMATTLTEAAKNMAQNAGFPLTFSVQDE